MNQKETALTRYIVGFDQTEERRKLEARITQAQRDERCVQRAVSLMALFTMLGAAAVFYDAVLDANPSYGGSRFVIRLIFDLGLASMISLVAFVVLLMAYRARLSRLRDECRVLVTKLLESRLSKPQRQSEETR